MVVPHLHFFWVLWSVCNNSTDIWADRPFLQLLGLVFFGFLFTVVACFSGSSFSLLLEYFLAVVAAYYSCFAHVDSFFVSFCFCWVLTRFCAVFVAAFSSRSFCRKLS